MRVDGERRDDRQAETVVRRVPVCAAVEALEHAALGVGRIDGLRSLRIEREGVRPWALRFEAHVRRAPPAAAVGALEDAGAAGGRVHGLRVARVDDQRGHLHVPAIAAVAAHRRVQHAPAAPAVVALDHPASVAA